MKQIIFVCRHNRFRSQLAEGFFNKWNKNKNIKAKSAGIFKGLPVAPIVKKVAKEFGIRTGKTKTIDERDLINADLFVIVADNIPKSLFNRAKKLIVWKIPDTGQENLERIREIAGDINKKVEKLVKEIK